MRSCCACAASCPQGHVQASGWECSASRHSSATMFYVSCNRLPYERTCGQRACSRGRAAHVAGGEVIRETDNAKVSACGPRAVRSCSDLCATP